MISLIIMLVVVGAALYLLSLAPIDATIKQIIYVIIIVAVIVYVLRNLGTLGVSM